MMEGYDIKELHDEAGRFYGVRIEQEVVQLTREEFKIVCGRISVLRRDNDELRELVRELWASCPVHDDDCADCNYRGGRTGCKLYDRMMELGVEV